MKRTSWAAAPIHARIAIHAAAGKWETTDGTPLVELLEARERETGYAGSLRATQPAAPDSHSTSSEVTRP